MGGLIIVLLTLVAIVAIVLLILYSFEVRDALRDLFHRNDSKNNEGTKILLFIPYLILEIWCLFLNIFLFFFALFGLYNGAKTGRNWWHKGK